MDSSSSSSSSDGIVHDCGTPDELLVAGLTLVGRTAAQLARKNLSRSTKDERMVSHSGVNSHVCAQVYEDLQRAPNKCGPVPLNCCNVRDFFLAPHSLKLCE